MGLVLLKVYGSVGRGTRPVAKMEGSSNWRKHETRRAKAGQYQEINGELGRKIRRVCSVNATPYTLQHSHRARMAQSKRADDCQDNPLGSLMKLEMEVELLLLDGKLDGN